MARRPALEDSGPGFVVWVQKAEAPKSKQITDPFASMYGSGIAIEPPGGGESLERLWSIFEENAIHSACVGAKAFDSVGAGWKLVSKAEGDESSLDKVKADESMLRDLLATISRKITFPQLLLQAALESDAVGWSAWEISRDAGGTIDAIFPVPPYSIRATKIDGVYVQIVGGETKYFVEFGREKDVSVSRGPSRKPTTPEDTPNELLIFRHYTPRSPWYGLPLWISAIPAIVEFTAIREFNLATFTGSGQTDRIVHVEAKEAKTAQKKAADLKNQFKEAAGYPRATLISHGTQDVKVNVTPLQQPVREASYIRRREDVIKEILIAHSVPPYRVGWAELGSLGGSSAKEMLRAYRTGAIEPLQEILETKVNTDLFGEKGLGLVNYRWELVDINWDQMAEDVSSVATLIQNATITPNEGRARIKLPPGEDPLLDKFYMNGKPIEKAGAEPANPFGGAPMPFGARPGQEEGPPTQEKPPEEGEPTEKPEEEAEKIKPKAKKSHDAEKHRTPWIKAVAGEVGKRFSAERSKLTRACRREKNPKRLKAVLEGVIDAGAKEWKTLFEKAYARAAAEFAALQFENLKKLGKLPEDAVPRIPIHKDLPSAGVDVDYVDAWEEYVLRRLRDRDATAMLVKGVVETTKDKIRSILATALEEGEGVFEIAKRIDSLYLDQIIPNRSEVIARTEIVAASNEGSLVGAITSGLRLQKLWLSQEDGKVREAHQEAADEGRWYPIDDPFVVGGEKLMYPGDTSMGASPENTIQCRCTQIYREVDENDAPI